jgi:hypothetical protein
MSAKKIDCFKYGRDIGQMEFILLHLLTKAINQEDLLQELEQLQAKLDMLQLLFRQKCVKRTTNLADEILQLQEIDKQLLQLEIEMKHRGISFWDKEFEEYGAE